jgi:hypothetical protein
MEYGARIVGGRMAFMKWKSVSGVVEANRIQESRLVERDAPPG